MTNRFFLQIEHWRVQVGAALLFCLCFALPAQAADPYPQKFELIFAMARHSPHFGPIRTRGAPASHTPQNLGHMMNFSLSI